MKHTLLKRILYALYVGRLFLLCALLACMEASVLSMEDSGYKTSLLERMRLLLPWSSHMPLYKAACSGDYKGVESLIDQGAVIDPRNVYPLHEAVKYGHVTVAQLLIERGANPNRYNLHGQTPLHVAISSGHVSCIELLLNRNVDVNKRLEKPDEDASWGSTSLHCLLRSSRYQPEKLEQLVRLLIVHGADILVKENVWGQTPLHLVLGNTRLIKVLLCAPQGMLIDTDDRTPESLVEAHMVRVMQALTISDNDGYVPYQFAKKYRRSHIVIDLLMPDYPHLLRLHGSDIQEGYRRLCVQHAMENHHRSDGNT